MYILDLFGGTGSVGIEALSQGAAHCVFLDTQKRAIETIRENLEATELGDRAEVRHTDAFLYLRNSSRSFDLIYVAPPQYEGMWVEAIQTIAERPQLVRPGGLVIVQIDPKEYESLSLTTFAEGEQRRYGNTTLLFYLPTHTP